MYRIKSSLRWFFCIFSSSTNTLDLVNLLGLKFIKEKKSKQEINHAFDQELAQENTLSYKKASTKIKSRLRKTITAEEVTKKPCSRVDKLLQVVESKIN